MIISKTPLRISFCGGGTDLKEYWEDHEGAVISSAINRNIFVIVKDRIDSEIWLKYSENEITKKLDDVKHTRWKECMKMTGVIKGVELACLSDIPKGSGLGGSSAFTVGSLNALHTLDGRHKSAKELAEEATKIEIDILKEPIGPQDQYATAYGGLNLIEFKKDGNVLVNPIIISNTLRNNLFSNLLLFNTGITRDASFVLSEQKKETKSKTEILHKMKESAYSSRDALYSSDLRKFGELLHQNWEYKKNMASNISNNSIDEYYNIARKAGAIGGKICGAGAGGFLLFYVEPEKQDKVRLALKSLKEVPMNFESSGSKIIYFGGKE
ncbi:MAG: GHMP kinase [Candidatus Pacearchaeota archaeon]|nr:GHMP kinase [Candidatus Pacearchaeota archaeon]